MSEACGCGAGQPCGCCAGIEVVTPQAIANRPGLPALVYRAGTYATFFESMLARLSTMSVDVPASDGSGTIQRLLPLAGLTTRDLADPSIALLDAWAVVADVLTFYEERIANEGFLRTATERLSVLELARLVGYRLRPGISSSVYLAFTVNAGFNGIVPAGTRAQSIPAPGQKPQPFETADGLPARDVWNNLKPRLTRPQIITLASSPVTHRPVAIDQGTDATTRDTLYFAGVATNLKAGDALLIVSGDGAGQQCLRFVESVNVQDKDQRTEVTLQEPPLSLASLGTGGAAQRAIAALQQVLEPYIADAATLFSGGDLAAQVAAILQQIITDANTYADSQATGATAAGVAALLGPVLPQLDEKHDIAVRRGFTRLEPWIADISAALRLLSEQLPRLDHATTVTGPPGVAITGGAQLAMPTLGRLVDSLDRLARPPSVQPANTFRLARRVSQVFSPASDVAPRLIAAFRPAAASTLYQAWGAIETPPSPIQVFAMRVKAAPFGNNAPLKVTYSGGSPSTPSYSEWPVVEAAIEGPSVAHESDSVVALDASYDKVLSGSWVVVDTRGVDTTQTQILAGGSGRLLFAKAGEVTTVSRADYGMSGKTTRLPLTNPATSQPIDWLDTSQGTANEGVDFVAIRQTVVYAQPEALDLAEEPLDRDVAGSTIELAGLYDGLESGRWIIVSGERTDITDAHGGTNATGVTGNELVMVAGVTQGPGKQSCLPLTVDAVPFGNVYSVAGPNAAGDLLVVGVPNAGFAQFLSTFPLPDGSVPNQQICNPIQLAPGLYANAYVPTAAERTGDFSAFAGLLLDPANKDQPFPGGLIPPSRINPGTGNPAPVFAWRIASLASGNDTLHTTLTLANALAYQYDSSTVTIYGNVAKATHGQTQGEVLGDGRAGEALQQFPLHQSPLTYLPAPTPDGASSTLHVRVNEVEWHEADNLFVLGPSDREFVTRTDDANNTTVLFGDGSHGLRVPTGTGNVKAVYRSGTGKDGNVDARQISQLPTQPIGVTSVINPLPAKGGADGDTRDQARRNVPIGITALDRLVSVQDYADFARKFAGIGKASARRLTDGRKLLVHLTIAGKDDVPIDPTTDLYRALVLALAGAGDPNQPVQIALRRLKLLVMAAGVKVAPDYAWETVAAALRARLLDLYSFDRRSLGQSAFLSEAVSAMQAVPGVQYVDMRTFDAVPESVTAKQLATLSSTLGLNSFVEAELAHVDPAAVDPARRIAPAEIVVLTPDIPDTLILTEITT